MSLPAEKPPPLTDVERERLVLRHLVEQQSRRVRPQGVLAMILGMFLVAIIGVVAWYTVPALLADGDTVNGTRFNGGAGARFAILAVYSLVGALGLIVSAAGAIQFATGRRFHAVARLALFLGGLLFAFAIGVRIWL